MKNLDRFYRKSYAMQRMTLAIERAIERPTGKEKERAARWAAAWGLLCGIRTDGVKLRGGDVQRREERISRSSDQIGIAAPRPSSRTQSHGELCAPPADALVLPPPSVNADAPFVAGIFDPEHPL